MLVKDCKDKIKVGDKVRCNANAGHLYSGGFYEGTVTVVNDLDLMVDIPKLKLFGWYVNFNNEEAEIFLLEKREFKVGDIVRLKEGFSECEMCGVAPGFNANPGDEGVFLGNHSWDNDCAVDFGKDVGGHDCNGRCPDKHGQNICKDHLELVEEPYASGTAGGGAAVASPSTTLEISSGYSGKLNIGDPVFWSTDYNDSINSLTPITMLRKIPNTLKRLLNKDLKDLYRAEYINGDLALTEKGKSELLNLLAMKHQTALGDLAREEIKQIKEDKKNK